MMKAGRRLAARLQVRRNGLFSVGTSLCRIFPVAFNPSGEPMQRIAISYRRSDSTAIAGRIADRLAATYGRPAVFIDVDSVPLGTDFRKRIQEVWTEIAVLLVVIGPSWLGIEQGAAAGRIHKRDDPVRIEVETALKREIAVIPVLVDGASMPSAGHLPKSLRAFADRNAAEVDGGRDFHVHMDRLIQAIDAIVGRDAGAPHPRSPATNGGTVENGRAPLTAASGRAEQSPSPQPLLRDVVVSVFVLVALQHVIINVLDLDTIYLRIVSFVVPFASGTVSCWQTRREPLVSLALSAGVGLIAVAAMAVTTGLSSGQPIVPATSFEWRESIEYAVSIAASFFVGSLLPRLLSMLPSAKA